MLGFKINKQNKKKLGLSVLFLLVFTSLAFLVFYDNDKELPVYNYETQSINTMGNQYEKEIKPGKTLSYKLILNDYGGVKYTPNCIRDCHLPIELNYNNKLKLNENSLKKYFYDKYGGFNSNCVKNYKVNYAINETYYITEKKVIECNPYTIIKSFNNDSSVKQLFENCSYETNLIPKTKIVWEELDLKKGFDWSGDKIVLDFTAQIRDKCKTDIVPEIEGYKLKEFAWWNNSWTNYRPINITNNDGSYPIATNFTLNFTLDTTTLIDENKLNSDCSDLRLVFNDQSIPFVFGNETDSLRTHFGNNTGCDSATTLIFAEMNFNISASTTNTTGAFVYYGNPTAQKYNNDSYKIFHWYDDFDDGKLAHWLYDGGASFSNKRVCSAGAEMTIQGNISNTNLYMPFYKVMGTVIGSGGPNKYEYILLSTAANSGQGFASSNHKLATNWETSPTKEQVRVDASLVKDTNYAFTSNQEIALDYYSNNGDFWFYADKVRQPFTTTNNTDTNYNAFSKFSLMFRDSSVCWDNIILMSILPNMPTVVIGSEFSLSGNESWGAVNISIKTADGNSTFYTNNDLYLSWAEDNSTDSGNYTISGNKTNWYIDSVYNSTFDNLTLINSIYTTKGETWKAEVFLFNGSTYSDGANSTGVLILNRPPTQPTQNSPPNNLLTDNLTQVLNCSGSTDIDNDTITYIFENDTAQMGNGTNGTLGIHVNYNGTLTWRCFTDDGDGGQSTKTGFWNIIFDTGVIKNIQEYHIDPENAGQLTNLFFNVTYNNATVNNLNAYVNYNGVNHIANKLEVNDSYTAFNATNIFVPFGVNNVSFFWNLTVVQNSTSFNQVYNYIQNITEIEFIKCSGNAGEIEVFNYTLLDETTREVLNGNVTIEADYNFSSNYGIGSVNFYNSTNTTNLKICINNDTINSTFIIDGTVKYYADNYVTEYYYHQNYNLTIIESDLPENINLYDLTSAESTSYIVNYENARFLPVGDAIIEVYRYYVDIGQKINVENGLTNEQGDTVLHLINEDVIYYFQVIKNNEILFISDDYQVVCQTTPCQINLRETETGAGLQNISEELEIAWSLTKNVTSKTISLYFINTDLESSNIVLNVTIFDNYLNNTVCSDNSNTITDTLSCTIPQANNGTFIIRAYKNNQLFLTDFITISDNKFVFGLDGYLYTGLLILTMIMLFVGNVIFMLFAGIGGLIIAGMLNFMQTGSLFGAGSALLWLLIVIIIIIIKIVRKEQG